MQEKARIEKMKTRIIAFQGDIDVIDDMTGKKTPLAKYCQDNTMIPLNKKASGNRVGLESEVFDQVFNILISIRRSLNNVCELPG